MNHVELQLLGRKCLRIPKYLSFSIDEYVKIVYELMQNSWAEQKIQYVIGCYSREMMPKVIYNVCVIADIHNLEFLADLEQWHRTKKESLLESIYFKYLKSIALYKNNYEQATFFDWLIREEGYDIPRFSAEDYKVAFYVNLVTLLHESAHFFRNFDEFDTVFEEEIAPDSFFIKRDLYYMKKLKRESKADYMGLLMLLDNTRGITKEQMIEMYFRSLVGTSFFRTFISHMNNDYTKKNEVQSYYDRAYVVIRYLIGMRDIVPGLDMAKVSFELLEDFPNGLSHLGEFMFDKMKSLMEKYEELPNSYKETILCEVIREENELLEKREYAIYPNSGLGKTECVQ